MTIRHVLRRRALVAVPLAALVFGAPPVLAATGQNAPAPPEPTTTAPAADGGAITTTTAPTGTGSASTTTTTTAPLTPVPLTPALPKEPAPPPGRDGRSKTGRIVGLSDALATVPVSGSDAERAESERARVAAELAQARADAADLVGESQRLMAEVAAIDDSTRREAVRRTKLVEQRDRLGADLRNIAVQRYVNGRDDVLLPPPGLALDETMERSQVATLSGEASRSTASAIDHVEALIADSDARVERWRTQRGADLAEANEVAARRRNAQVTASHWASSLPALEQTARDTRLLAFVAGSDLPLIALDAYWRAAVRERIINPACRIPWWALAGIGRTESNHGHAGGGLVGAGGIATRPIIGLTLDGSGATAAIGDTDRGFYDGDPVWDHAVGPMQFIPGTWRGVAVDLNGDGVADPQNIYDAAAASADYLCRYGPGLDTDAGLQVAFMGYNHSASYVALVLERAKAYQLLPVPSLDPPVPPLPAAPLPEGATPEPQTLPTDPATTPG